MRTIFRLLVVLPVALVIVAFAVANRHWVSVSFDPFPGNDIDVPSIHLPLFVLMFVCGMLGVLAGGMVVWWRQGRYRRQLRDARDEATEARGQANDLRDRLSALDTSRTLPAPRRDAA